MSEFIVVIKGEAAVGKGFYGNDPDRFWVALDSDDAKVFATEEQAQRFMSRVGDQSWGLAVQQRA